MYAHADLEIQWLHVVFFCCCFFVFVFFFFFQIFNAARHQRHIEAAPGCTSYLMLLLFGETRIIHTFRKQRLR